MTHEERQEIVIWLRGPRNYAAGVRLYARHGINRMYRRRFTLEETEFTRTLLAEELRKLAGMGEVEFRSLRREAAATQTRVEVQEDTHEIAIRLDLTEPARKMIRFRDKYPFLNAPDCPDVLKVLVADMFTAYDTYKAAHASLATMADEDVEAAAIEAERVVEAYLTNREIRDELDHYRDTGQILGRAAKFREMEQTADLEALSDLELARKLGSARANQSKQRKAVKEAEAAGIDSTTAAEALERWTGTRARLEAEIERRKKK